jgi:aminobenzoyl-glutamate transport protein
MTERKKNKGDFFKRMLDRVEVIGNKLPQPVTLFAILMGITLHTFLDFWRHNC